MTDVPVEATINGFFILAILAVMAVLVVVRISTWGIHTYRKRVRGEFREERTDEY